MTMIILILITIINTMCLAMVCRFPASDYTVAYVTVVFLILLTFALYYIKKKEFKLYNNEKYKRFFVKFMVSLLILFFFGIIFKYYISYIPNLNIKIFSISLLGFISLILTNIILNCINLKKMNYKEIINNSVLKTMFSLLIKIIFIVLGCPLFIVFYTIFSPISLMIIQELHAESPEPEDSDRDAEGETDDEYTYNIPSNSNISETNNRNITSRPARPNVNSNTGNTQAHSTNDTQLHNTNNSQVNQRSENMVTPFDSYRARRYGFTWRGMNYLLNNNTDLNNNNQTNLDFNTNTNSNNNRPDIRPNNEANRNISSNVNNTNIGNQGSTNINQSNYNTNQDNTNMANQGTTYNTNQYGSDMANQNSAYNSNQYGSDMANQNNNNQYGTYTANQSSTYMANQGSTYDNNPYSTYNNNNQGHTYNSNQNSAYNSAEANAYNSAQSNAYNNDQSNAYNNNNTQANTYNDQGNINNSAQSSTNMNSNISTANVNNNQGNIRSGYPNIRPRTSENMNNPNSYTGTRANTRPFTMTDRINMSQTQNRPITDGDYETMFSVPDFNTNPANTTGNTQSQGQSIASNVNLEDSGHIRNPELRKLMRNVRKNFLWDSRLYNLDANYSNADYAYHTTSNDENRNKLRYAKTPLSKLRGDINNELLDIINILKKSNDIDANTRSEINNQVSTWRDRLNKTGKGEVNRLKMFNDKDLRNTYRLSNFTRRNR